MCLADPRRTYSDLQTPGWIQGRETMRGKEGIGREEEEGKGRVWGKRKRRKGRNKKGRRNPAYA